MQYCNVCLFFITLSEYEKCIHCSQLILRKICKIGATRCQILKLKCTKFDFRWGFTPNPTGGAYSAPWPLVFKGPTSKGREAEGGRKIKGERVGEGKRNSKRGSVTVRQASASFNQPVTVKRSTTTYSSSKDKPPTGRPAMPLRRLLALDHDDEEELIDMPSIPATRSVIRSSSVPPRLLPLPPRDATTRHHMIRTDSHVVPPEVAHHHGVQVYGKVLSGVHEPYVTVCVSAKFCTNIYNLMAILRPPTADDDATQLSSSVASAV